MRRPLVCLVLWLSMAFVACGSAAHYTELSGPTTPSSTAVEIRQRLPVTTAKIGGVSVELVLDLGSTHALTLPRATLAAIGAKPTGEAHSFTDAQGHRLMAAVYTVPVLRWGGAEWRNVRAVEAVWHPDYAPPVKLGVLGRPLFKERRIALALGAGKAMVGPSVPCGPEDIPISEHWGVVVPVELDGERVQALLDTAATHNISTEPRFDGPIRLEAGGRAHGETPFVTAALDGLPTPVILGVPFFAAHTVSIDLESGCVSID